MSSHWDVVQEVKHLPSKPEALSSNLHRVREITGLTTAFGLNAPTLIQGPVSSENAANGAIEKEKVIDGVHLIKA
jgi:hypothetical protein